MELALPAESFEVFSCVLDYMYSKELEIEDGTQVPAMMEIARRLQMVTLRDALEQRCATVFADDSALECLELAMRLGHPTAANQAGLVAENNFCSYAVTDFVQLSLQTLEIMLGCVSSKETSRTVSSVVAAFVR